MSLSSRKEYVNELHKRYSKAGAELRKSISDELCQTAGYNRKYAIKLLTGNRSHESTPRSRPPRKYSSIFEHLKTIWLASNQMCGKRLKSVLPEWVIFYQRHYGKLSEEDALLLENISASQIDRELSKVKVNHFGKRRHTKPGTLLKKQIPYACDTNFSYELGFLETDTVAHCGGSLQGNYLWSITFTCWLTGWTENRCMYRKSKDKLLAHFKDLQEELPFNVRGIDFDNGTEYINESLITYCQTHGIAMTRSRPYHKNDNAHVEQRNWTHVRELLGYDRLNDPKQETLANDLYQNYWNPYLNYFCPTMKLTSKSKTGGKWRKKYDKAKTPYHRLLEGGKLSRKQENMLIENRSKLDPFELKIQIERKLEEIFALRAKDKLAA